MNLNDFAKNQKYLVFSGIGNHKTFISMIKYYGFNILKEIEFADHYKYNAHDIQKILDEASKLNCKIITTEKDYFRIKEINKNDIKYIKSDLKILNEEKFLKSIL